MEVNQIAFDLSRPGDPVTPSEVVREAIDLYVEQFANDPSKCDPRSRGAIGGESFVEIEVDEGAA